MKLILKRVGEDSRQYQPITSHHNPEQLPDSRPFALCTENGQQLPGQQTTSMTSDGDGMVKLTVVFRVDGTQVLVEGDTAPC
ncbi:hypothetical protein [Pseudomonas syringae]|uniref:Uncharacterized protein n=1 Tax=Pseudomonas syringae TaxID=317 RepID=A0A085V3W9_PSESX|nr:hypothetical protein [Pseudomonas syringae]KFE50132.1 hypothetical protein IV01_26020 [Pseudomonas syringae]